VNADPGLVTTITNAAGAVISGGGSDRLVSGDLGVGIHTSTAGALLFWRDPALLPATTPLPARVEPSFTFRAYIAPTRGRHGKAMDGMMRPLEASTTDSTHGPGGTPRKTPSSAASQLSAKSAKRPNGQRTSEVLREFVARQTEPRVSLGALRDALGDRGFGVLILFFALPNLVPLNIPLLSAVLGVPLVLLAAQLTYGRHEPWFPNWLTRQSFPRESFAAVVNRSLPYLEATEKLLRPRLTRLLSWTGERFVGVALLVMALVLTAPIPFGNWLPAFAIAIIGIAMVEKDGLAVIIGLIFGVIGVGIAGTVVFGLVKAFLFLLSSVGA
jgi:hypothetical protein